MSKIKRKVFEEQLKSDLSNEYHDISEPYIQERDDVFVDEKKCQRVLEEIPF